MKSAQSGHKDRGATGKTDALREKLVRVPRSPGVYLMKNAEGNVIYVGKAANLKNRLNSYFSKTVHMDAKTGVLVKKITDFETLVTASETEALILESNLIKRYRPRYNVILKDDKRYPSLRIDLRQHYPNLTVVRKIKKDGAQYFGPYASAGAVKQTLKLINRTFKLRKCKAPVLKPRSRPCLNFQIDACLAPCCHPVAREEYMKIVDEVRMFLNGRTPDLIRHIQAEMRQAAAEQEFEVAARLRDKMFALEKTLEKQVAVTTDFVDRDVIAVDRMETHAIVMLLKVRNGFLQGMRDFFFNDAISGNTEILGAFIRQYYDHVDAIPSEILTNVDTRDMEVYGRWLSEIKGRKVAILHPKRGDKVRIVQMAVENARERLSAKTRETETIAGLLSGLQRRLHLNRYPERIECLDNSGLFGTDMVSGLVVFESGAPKKSRYRRYRIRTVSEQDDYGCMKEALSRRFRKTDAALPLPDLLMVDGGKGQLNVAVAVLRELELDTDLDVIGIAKKDDRKGEPEDKIFLPGRANPVNFQKHLPELHFLQRIRDEAHRYAVSYHRKKRGERSLKSMLDDIPGIGAKRKTLLLRKYQSIDQIRAASIEELAALQGMTRKAAEAVVAALVGGAS